MTMLLHVTKIKEYFILDILREFTVFGVHDRALIEVAFKGNYPISASSHPSNMVSLARKLL